MATISKKTPSHLWVVATLSLLWNAYGVYDYLMSVTANEAYLANFPPELIEMMSRFPVWATALWAIGVWFSFAGSVLLFFRSRLAASAFLVSLLGAAGSFAYQATLDRPGGVDAAMYYLMPIVILVVIVAQWWYARRQAAAGVLR